MAGVSKNLRELVGPLLPPKDQVEEEDEFAMGDGEEEAEDSVFVDAEELCSGGVKAGGLPWRQHVVIHDENTQEQCKVVGRFPIMGPWWQVKVQVKPVGSRKYIVQGFPSYFLRSNMSPPDQKNICSLFLKECGIPCEVVSQFLAWVKKASSYEDLSFENLKETLRTFYKEIRKKDKRQSAKNEQPELLPDNEISLLENQIPFVHVMTALQFPKIMEFLPVLLPRYFKRLISTDSKVVLEAIEEILGTQPWKLGFSRITYRDLKLLRCEASWTAFSQCPSLLQLMTDLEKNALDLYSKLKQICREHGHTYVEQASLTSQLYYDVWQSLEFLKDIGVVTFRKDCVFLHELYQAERSIASLICDLMKRPPWHLHVDVRKVLASIHTTKLKDSRSEESLKESKPDETRLENSIDILELQDSDDHIWDEENDINAEMNEVQLDHDQVTALEMICSNAVTVISGKGGCGKTTIVSRLFKYIEQFEESEVKKACEDFEQDQDVPEEWTTFTEQGQSGSDKPIEVLLTAPTGKAAGLLREKTSLPAYTLCQVNYSFYFWTKNLKKKNLAWKFSSVRVLVVDEGSLVSVGIFKSVLKLLCEHSRLSKLIILGDIRQLPSIEPGNLLKDLFDTLKSRKCAIELKTNHRAESQLIVDNATRISERQFPKFDAELNISENSAFPISIQDKTFIFVRLLEEYASSQSSKSDHKSYLYSAVKALLQESDFKSAETSQFIAFRRQDCDLINDCCCKHYTGHLTRDHQKRLIFGIDDKICCTKNAYLSELLPENPSETEPNSDLQASGEGFCGTPHDFSKNKHELESGIRLCNGEIFFITNDVTDVTFGKRRSVTISNMAGLEVTVDFRKLMKYCHIKHAWARTIHTFQGSEEHTVAYVVGKAGRQHWQHVYTAVTRGRCRVYVIAEESQLQSAIRRPDILRQTRLKHFLQNELSVRCASLADRPSQPESSGESGGPSLPAAPLPKDTTNTVTGGVAKSQSSLADDGMATFVRGWRFSSFDEMYTDEDLSPPPGSKRTSGVHTCDSPSKVSKVEEPSPQVSSKLQNLRLNKLIPKQLFKPIDNQENFTSDCSK
ncbi:DNA helicase B isoform X1 [Heterocephalus glaber]|uniref:DNA helicase B n=2 Tax=Heterocephalus glaber TaxID=10181 RepID=A0AAX6PYE7_HETGA|nr:DNA helicase B isoform X1 [Heterocephalus glaber]